ncbi:hypothetical protein Oweho_1859 [Owenweeksia hongkongensis DSM 17368]|uniref:Uncharacterized protein n=1 Tax=Owenweeksia hongkongensis (strain DSM 17368 / CIP 108786 / JCM 12287 / NRRL B-23963 / UST20020801) TaxID=926562 RepID=G8R1R2_OWEHD|nr:hypothetical protein [Owenweeksia hongkongensis]AEV32838.1 hypothetical protein Oweho_1859 [Owenweeksia hongkongensis DSM 17368]
MRYFLLPILLLLSLCSCDKLKNNSYHEPIIIKTNAPVPFGDSLAVWIESNKEGYNYRLFHPTGLYKGASYNTRASYGSDRGTYIAEAIGDETRTDSLYVDLIPLTAPCSPSTNQLIGDNGIYFDLNSAVETTLPNYTVKYQTDTTSLTLRFKKSSRPQGNATYISTSSTYSMLEYDVFVTMESNGQLQSLTNQPIYVEVNNGTISISLCNFALRGYSQKIYIDANLQFSK